jgi:hypothetical protein
MFARVASQKKVPSRCTWEILLQAFFATTQKRIMPIQAFKIKKLLHTYSLIHQFHLIETVSNSGYKLKYQHQNINYTNK